MSFIAMGVAAGIKGFTALVNVKSRNANTAARNKLAQERNTATVANAIAIDDALAVNMLREADAAAEEAMVVSMQKREAAGAAAAEAAATGARGSGTDRTQRDISRNAAIATGRIEDALEASYYQYDLQRLQNAANVRANWDYGEEETSKLGNILNIGGNALLGAISAR